MSQEHLQSEFPIENSGQILKLQPLLLLEMKTIEETSSKLNSLQLKMTISFSRHMWSAKLKLFFTA
jgi:hypothetical protein